MNETVQVDTGVYQPGPATVSVTTSRFGFTLREAGTFSTMQTVSPMVLYRAIYRVDYPTRHA